MHQASEALEQLLRIVAKGPRLGRNTTTDDRLREAKILQRLAFDFRMPEEQLRSRLSQLRRPSTGQQRGRRRAAGRRRAEAAEIGPSRRASESRPKKIPLTSWERELLELVVAAPVILGRAAESVKPSQLNAPFAREIYTRALDLAAAGVDSRLRPIVIGV